MRNKLGQLSVETMILYGLVILIALGVIGGLIYFNVLDIGSYLPEQCDLGGTGDLKCEEMSFMQVTTECDSSHAGDDLCGQLDLGVRNIGQKPISYLGVNATDSDGTHFSRISSADGTVDGVIISDTHTLAPGEIALVSIITNGANPGKTLRASLNTHYMFKGGVVTQEPVGTLRVKVSE